MLLLTALNDKGNVPVGSGALIQVGLTGALLADLAIDGRLAVAEDGTVRAGDTRPGDELLADACDAVREHLQGRNVRQVIGGLSHHIGGSWNRVVDRLINVGVLGRDRPSLLRPTRHPVLDTAARQAVLDQIRAAAAGEGPVSSQVAVVLALIGPCRLLERVAPDPGTRGEAKRRIDRVTAETPFAPGVAKIVDELIVAITVTATIIPPSFVFLAAGRDVLSQESLPSGKLWRPRPPIWRGSVSFGAQNVRLGRPGPGSQPVVHPHPRLDVDRVVMLDAAMDRHKRSGHHDRARLVERQAGPGTPLI
jgi:Golgi phosphoprotein 3 (GPP34)